MIHDAQDRVCGLDSGAAVLFEMHRETEVKPSTPFVATMEKDSWSRYCIFVGQILMYIFRTQEWRDEDRPAYTLTRQQGNIFDRLSAIVGSSIDSAGDADDADVQRDQMDKHCRDLVVALFDHHYHISPYESVVISALAVMGIRGDNGWEEAQDYTMRYSAMVKIARIAVVAQSMASLEKEVSKRVAGGQDVDEAREFTESLFVNVRRKVDRFMTRATAKSQPGVMDWILTTRTYGLKIVYTTLAEGHIQWDGDRITFHRIQFTMNELRAMVYQMVRDTRKMLGDALLLASGPDQEEPVGFPEIPWDLLQDDHGDSRIGYSFLQDDRNPWPVEGTRWLAERISSHPELKHRWFRGEQGQPIRQKAAKAFGRLADDIRGRLLVLCHMVSGQPGRSTEMLGPRMFNTRQGGIRNIFIYQKMVCLVVGYHKRYQASNKLKMIFRFLPREVGELVVWYLWLALPFWQQLQGVMRKADYKSPFIFAEAVVHGTMSKKTRDKVVRGDDPFWDTPPPEGVEEQGVEDSDGQTGLRYGVDGHMTWAPDRMRRLLKEHSGRYLGTEFNISSWRHLAIAINRKYCYGQFVYEDDDNDKGTEEDRPEDLQAGHTTYIGQAIYARGLQEIFSTSGMRDKFLAASKTWHRFLGLGHTEGMFIGKRRLEPFEEHSAEGRMKRQRRLAEVDLGGRLRQMLNNESAAFRPGQERVLQAIHRGYSPILQIVGTGGGKSLSFMLPAYCAGDGVTIVIVPLVALREDMVRRCEAARIQSYVWSASSPVAGSASIIFVTPESATTKAFASYVTGLRTNSRLDRMVVDECHMILDSASQNSRFRPAFLEIGKFLEGTGVQLIFLTATLAPRDETMFFQHAHIPRDRSMVFRSRTTRGNIRYQVQEVDMDEEDDVEDCLAQAVEEELRLCEQRFPSGKIIIYCGTIVRAQSISRRLNCPAYYNQAGNAKQKREILEEWMEHGRAIAATNALGVGLDVPDVREVIHVTSPRRIRDFAQESGRAGRDKQESRSVIIRQSTGPIRENMIHQAPRVESRRQLQERRRREKQEQRSGIVPGDFIEDDMAEFLETVYCRRVILDKVMDGIEREGCAGDENFCDLCEQRGSMLSDEEGDESTDLLQDNMEEQFIMAESARQRAKGERKKEGRDWALFRDWLPKWQECCFICMAHPEGEEGWIHRQGDCPLRGGRQWEGVDEMKGMIGQGVFGDKMLQQFSGCSHCGIPQMMCESWEAKRDDMGRFQKLGQEWHCQFEGEAIRIVAEISKTHGEMAWTIAKEMMNGDGVGEVVRPEDDLDPWLAWMGRRVIWAGHETNNLCKYLFKLVARCYVEE
jgi:superfamily II DNA helicase RecQ